MVLIPSYQDYEITVSSQFGISNLVLAQFTMPVSGWIKRIGVIAGGDDASTPAELVAYWGNFGYLSGRQTWDNVLRERTIDLPSDPYAAPALYKYQTVYVGFWSDPNYTRQWGTKKVRGESYRTANSPGPNPPSKLPGTSVASGALSAWFEYIPNAKPPVPAWQFDLGGTPTIETADAAPSFYGTLTQAASEGGRDLSQTVQVQITDNTTGTIVYDKTKTITKAENDAGVFTLVAPFAHTRTHSYSARFRHYDRFGVWSEYSAPTLYTVIPGPRAPTDMLPAEGDNITTLNPTYYGVYAHDDDVAGGDYRILLYNADGRILLGDTDWLDMGGV